METKSSLTNEWEQRMLIVGDKYIRECDLMTGTDVLRLERANLVDMEKNESGSFHSFFILFSILHTFDFRFLISLFPDLVFDRFSDFSCLPSF